MKRIQDDPVRINLYAQIQFWKDRALKAERSNRLLRGQVTKRLNRVEKHIKRIEGRTRLMVFFRQGEWTKMKKKTRRALLTMVDKIAEQLMSNSQ